MYAMSVYAKKEENQMIYSTTSSESTRASPAFNAKTCMTNYNDIQIHKSYTTYILYICTYIPINDLHIPISKHSHVSERRLLHTYSQIQRAPEKLPSAAIGPIIVIQTSLA